MIAAVSEKNYDDQGIVWPREVAPFDVEILPLQMDNEEVVVLSRQYAGELQAGGLAVLVDDRQESPGRKFHDADLIGIPYRVVIGQRGLKEGMVEIKSRADGQVVKVAAADAVARLRERLRIRDGA